MGHSQIVVLRVDGLELAGRDSWLKTVVTFRLPELVTSRK